MALSDIFERLDRWVGYRPESRAITASDFARGADADEWFNTRTGEAVSLDSVLGIQHVWACVSLLVNDIRKLPIDTYRDAGSGRKVPIAKPRWMRTPDPTDTNATFRDHVGQAVLSLMVDGNAFIYAWPSVYNVEVLLVLDPTKVDIRGGRYHVHGYPEPLTDLNVRHVRGLVKPGSRRGMNPIQAAREGFGLTLAAERFGQRFFSNGAVMQGLVEVPQGVQVDPAELKKQMERNHKGADKSHALGVLTGGATFRQLSFSPEDTQFLGLRSFQLEEAARMFHIPPFKIGSTEPGAVAYASTSNARIDYVDSAISPIVVLLEDVYSDLIPGDDTFAKFNLSALLRGDPVTRSSALNTQAQAGVITRQEWRDLEDYGPADEAPGVGSENGGYLQTPNNTAAGGPSLIEQVQAGLLTENEARELLGRAPIEWGDTLSLDEIASLIEQVKAGLLTENEVRAMMKRPPLEWPDTLSAEESATLIEQVKAGLRTENEARELLKLPPIEWGDALSNDDIAALIEQVKSGLLTENEAREKLGLGPIAWPEDLTDKVGPLTELVKVGFDPASAARMLGLAPIQHLGLPPTSVQKAADVVGLDRPSSAERVAAIRAGIEELRAAR